MEERVKTFIPGLDELIDGGFIRNTSILITGNSGVGKSIFGLQFIYKGAMEANEPGAYVTFEQPPSSLQKQALKFGWNFEKLEIEHRKVLFAKYKPLQAREYVIPLIENTIKEVGAKRLVIDSITWLGLIFSTSEFRDILYRIAEISNELGCTTLFLSEIPSGKFSISRFGVEEFVTDCAIILYNSRINGFSKTITVWKMRFSKFDPKPHPFEITEEGIVIYPQEIAIL